MPNSRNLDPNNNPSLMDSVGPRALIVGDDPARVQAVVSALDEMGLSSLATSSGEEGLRKINEFEPRLVALCQPLPDWAPFQWRLALKRNRFGRSCPAVVLVGQSVSDPSSQAGAIRILADYEVNWPSENADLKEQLDKAVNHRSILLSRGIESEIFFELDNDVSSLLNLSEFLANLHAQCHLSPQQVYQFNQAIMEIGLNAIEWGNQSRRDTLIQMVHRVYRDRIELTVQDEGQGFDINHLPHAAQPDCPDGGHLKVREQMGLREGGFGLLIARGFLDELQIPSPGNQITLIKRFALTRPVYATPLPPGLTRSSEQRHSC